jgi:hypothetical protein
MSGLCACAHPLGGHVVIAWGDVPALGGLMFCQELAGCGCVLPWALSGRPGLVDANWRPPPSLALRWRQMLTAGQPFTIYPPAGLLPVNRACHLCYEDKGNLCVCTYRCQSILCTWPVELDWVPSGPGPGQGSWQPLNRLGQSAPGDAP